jgi:hypothetical protein
MCKSILVGLSAVLVATAGVAFADSPIVGPWQYQDVGDVGVPGSVSQFEDGETDHWNIAGSGSDIWGTADSFFFVYQPIEDGEVRLSTSGLSLENTDPHAKLALMFRQTLDAGSIDVIFDVQPDGSIEFMTRQTTSGETTYLGGLAPANHPWFLRLVRTNGTVTGRLCVRPQCLSDGRQHSVCRRTSVRRPRDHEPQ